MNTYEFMNIYELMIINIIEIYLYYLVIGRGHGKKLE